MGIPSRHSGRGYPRQDRSHAGAPLDVASLRSTLSWSDESLSRTSSPPGGLRMKPRELLTAATLINALFLTLHVADDISRGIDTIGLHTLPAMLVLGLWLYGTLMLSGRRWGYILQLLLAILGLGVVIIH